ncbi:hypothetical protein I4U23_019075 [Adineta vaga]|nr:hypothetical protein I4U23_019075 [Adineta vaga]
MSFIEGIGDDFLYAFGFLVFISIVILAWFSTHVNYIHFPATLFIIERRSRTRNEESERASSTSPSRLTPPNDQTISPSSGNDTQTEHESDNESSETEEFICEQRSTENQSINPTISEQSCSNTNSIEESNHQQTTSDEQENQSLKIIIKFLNETRKEISANPNDTISKIKQLYFADELTNNKMIRFIYQGRELQDRETLRTYNIRDQTVIHCQISTRRPDSSNQRSNGTSSGSHMNTNRFDTSAFIDAPPVNVSSHFVLILTVILGLVWYLRINYRMLFSPISTVILILITVIFLIFTLGSLLTRRQQVSNTRQTSITVTPPIQHKLIKQDGRGLEMSYYSNTDPCVELRNVLHRSLLSLGCPHVPSLPTSTFLMTTNSNLKVVVWLLGEVDSDLAHRLHATRSTNSIAFIKEFFLEIAMFPRSFILRLDDIFNSSSLVDLHQLSNILSYYVHKPIPGHNVQLGLIEYLSELVVCLRNPPMTIHHDMWGNREVLNMFEQLPIDDTNLAIDSRIFEYTDNEQQQQPSGDDEQTSADLKDVFGQVRTELLAQTTTDMNETEFETIFTNEQIIDIEKQLQHALADTHQFFKRLETGTPNLSTSIDHQSTPLLSNETLQKISSINHLNEIYNQVRSNDKLFLDKIQYLLNDIDKENDNQSKQTNPSALTLQSQVMLAQNLAHTLNNNDQIVKK